MSQLVIQPSAVHDTFAIDGVIQTGNEHDYVIYVGLYGWWTYIEEEPYWNEVMYSGYFPLDTSELPDDATISDATFLLAMNDGFFYNHGYDIGCGSHHGLFDYHSLYVPTSPYLTSFDLNATGIAAISKTGVTTLWVSTDGDEENGPGSIISSDSNTPSERPKLTINYTSEGGGSVPFAKLVTSRIVNAGIRTPGGIYG